MAIAHGHLPLTTPAPVLRRRDWVADLVRQNLDESAYYEVRQAICEHRQGIVVIRGKVTSFYLKQIAQCIVSKVPGVILVDNQLEVFDPESR